MNRDKSAVRKTGIMKKKRNPIFLLGQQKVSELSIEQLPLIITIFKTLSRNSREARN